jgi:hypothetical protein
MVGKFQIQVNKHLCVPGIDLKTKCPQNRKKKLQVLSGSGSGGCWSFCICVQYILLGAQKELSQPAQKHCFPAHLKAQIGFRWQRGENTRSLGDDGMELPADTALRDLRNSQKASCMTEAKLL